MTKYRIEWDTVSTFGSSNFGYKLQEMKVEVQVDIPYFRRFPRNIAIGLSSFCVICSFNSSIKSSKILFKQ